MANLYGTWSDIHFPVFPVFLAHRVPRSGDEQSDLSGVIMASNDTADVMLDTNSAIVDKSMEAVVRLVVEVGSVLNG